MGTFLVQSFFETLQYYDEGRYLRRNFALSLDVPTNIPLFSCRDGVENGIDWMVRCVKRNIYRPAHTKYELAWIIYSHLKRLWALHGHAERSGFRLLAHSEAWPQKLPKLYFVNMFATTKSKMAVIFIEQNSPGIKLAFEKRKFERFCVMSSNHQSSHGYNCWRRINHWVPGNCGKGLGKGGDRCVCNLWYEL